MLLTVATRNSNLSMPLQNVAVQNWRSEITRHKPLSTRHFYAKNSVLHLYVGLGKALERVAGSCVRYANFAQFRLHNWRYVVGVKILTHGGTIMPNQYAQVPTKANTPTINVRLKSLFTLRDANREIIADHLTFEQVKPISERITGSVIKFSRMGVSV